MNLVADEGVEKVVVEKLRRSGHFVLYILESAPGSIDEDVLSLANERGSLLLTNDRDFGEIVFRQRAVNAGVVLLRLAGMPNDTKSDLVASALQIHGEKLGDCFTVITPTRIRIRQRPENFE